MQKYSGRRTTRMKSGKWFSHVNRVRRRSSTRHRGCCAPGLRPVADEQLLLPLRSTPPDAFACDHDWQQVSWLAGQCLRPPSQEPVSPQWFPGRRLTAYSCGGSRGVAGQSPRTTFPWQLLRALPITKLASGSCTVNARTPVVQPVALLPTCEVRRQRMI
jgi:hypothetical protein